jgi:hypothetical protein
LEGRLVPNASRVIDAAGQLHIFVARYDGSLTRYDPEGATVWFTSGVTWAQTYVDPAGQLGVNVLFSDAVYRARWVVYDAAGGHDMGIVSYSSVSTAFDPTGQKILDVVTGVYWHEYDATGDHLKDGGPVGPNNDVSAMMASTAIDPTGARVTDFVDSISLIFATFFRQSVEGTWKEVNPAGTFTKGGGHFFLSGPNVMTSSGGGLSSVLPSFDATGALAYDIVRDGGEWDYYDAQGGHFMGTRVA